MVARRRRPCPASRRACGDRRSKAVDGAAYDNVGYYLARNGIVGITMSYRLVPVAKFPSGGEDVAAAAAWIRDHIAEYGGEPSKVFFIGHSAGGTLLGEYLYNPAMQGPEGPLMAGAIFLSGAVAPHTGDVAKAYLGDDPTVWQEDSVEGLLSRYQGRMVPTFLVAAELDPPEIENWTVSHLTMLCAKLGGCPRFSQIAGHNHITTALELNAGGERFGPQLLQFVHAVVAGDVWMPQAN
jgi:arylformamidase